MINKDELTEKIQSLSKLPVENDSNLLEGFLDSFALVNLLNYLEIESKKKNFTVNFDLMITSGSLSVNSIVEHIKQVNS